MLTLPDHEKIIKTYLNTFAFLEEDLFCREIKIYNTFQPGKFWDALKKIEGNAAAPFPYWSIVWAGGRALAGFILKNQSMFRGKKILDFACGNGITSIAAAIAGGEVTAFDIDPNAVTIAEKVNRINGTDVDFAVKDIFDVGIAEDVDIIIAGDVFNEKVFSHKLISYLKGAAGRGIICLAGDAMRMFRPRKDIQLLAEYRVPVYREIEGISSRDGQIIRILS